MEAQHYLEIMRRHLQESYVLDSVQVAEIMPRFLATLFQHMQTLEALQQQGDSAALAKASHAVRGALLTSVCVTMPNMSARLRKSAPNQMVCQPAAICLPS